MQMYKYPLLPHIYTENINRSLKSYFLQQDLPANTSVILSELVPVSECI